MVRALKPDDWPYSTVEERAAGWREPRFDRRKKADPNVPQWEERRGRAARPAPDTGPVTVEELAGALYETDPPESWMRTATDEYRKRAAAMIGIIKSYREAHHAD